MAACGIAFNAATDCRRISQFKAPRDAFNLRRTCLPLQIRCFSEGRTTTNENFELADSGPGYRFTMSDFSLCNNVSIGLSGKVISR